MSQDGKSFFPVFHQMLARTNCTLALTVASFSHLHSILLLCCAYFSIHWQILQHTCVHSSSSVFLNVSLQGILKGILQAQEFPCGVRNFLSSSPFWVLHTLPCSTALCASVDKDEEKLYQDTESFSTRFEKKSMLQEGMQGRFLC